MIGPVLLILIILALISAIWGKEAAQGCFSAAAGCVGVTLAVAFFTLFYTFDPQFRVFARVVGIALIVLLFFGVVRLAWAYADGQAAKAQKEETESRERFERQHEVEAEERQKAERVRWDARVRQQRDEAIEALIRQLKAAFDTRNQSECRRVAEALRTAGSLQLAARIIKLAVNDLDPALRLCAIRVLQFGYDSSYTGAVYKSFNSEAVCLLGQIAADRNENRQNRVAALVSVGKAGYTEAVPFVVEQLEDMDGDVRAAACNALGALGGLRTAGHDAVASLIFLLRDPQERARREAATALGKIGDLSALKALQALAAETSEVPSVRQAARDAVSHLQERAYSATA